MKYILFILLVGGIVGCDSWYEDSRMTREALLRKFDRSAMDAWRCLAQKKLDSAYYFQGAMEAFYEAAYNEKPPRSPIKP